MTAAQDTSLASKLPLRRAIFLGLLASGPACAADNWGYQPTLTQNLSWESNPLLLEKTPEALFGSVTTPSLTITDNSPTTQLSATGSAAENIFNQSDFNSTDLHTTINLDQKLEQWEAGFLEQTDYDTTRTSEITTLDTLSEGSVRHFENMLAPQIAYNPTTIDKVSVTGSALESRYYSDLFTDYHIFTLTPSYQRNLDPLNTATVSLQAQRYQTEASSQLTIDDIGPTVGWTGILSPTLTAKVTAGIEEYRQQSDTPASQQWKIESTYSADLSYKDEKDTVSLDGSRALVPYANGTEYFLNTVALSDNHALNTLFSTNVSASYQFAASSDQAATNLKSLVTANLGLAYHATDKLDITTSYQYREQTLTNVPGNQDDSLFTIGLVYRPKLDGLL